MPSYTVSLTDEQAKCVLSELTRPAPDGTPGKGDVATWLQANVTSMAKACVDAQTVRTANSIGITSAQDLTAADIAAIKAARGL